jgi:hypothetical protein
MSNVRAIVTNAIAGISSKTIVIAIVLFSAFFFLILYGDLNERNAESARNLLLTKHSALASTDSMYSLKLIEDCILNKHLLSTHHEVEKRVLAAAALSDITTTYRDHDIDDISSVPGAYAWLFQHERGQVAIALPYNDFKTSARVRYLFLCAPQRAFDVSPSSIAEAGYVRAWGYHCKPFSRSFVVGHCTIRPEHVIHNLGQIKHRASFVYTLAFKGDPIRRVTIHPPSVGCSCVQVLTDEQQTLDPNTTATVNILFKPNSTGVIHQRVAVPISTHESPSDTIIIPLHLFASSVHDPTESVSNATSAR